MFNFTIYCFGYKIYVTINGCNDIQTRKRTGKMTGTELKTCCF